MKLPERPFEVESGELRLEGALHEGSGALAAVVLHPHPSYGGTMDNHVVLACCEALAAHGATTLRFNLRGTGRSDGSFDNGRGEADDARAAIAALRGLRPDARLVLAGYSFGAAIAAGVAADAGLAGVILVSPPAGMKLASIDAELPALLITGEHDQVAPPAAIAGLETAQHRVVTVAGTDHGWWPGVEELASEVSAFAKSLLAAR